MKSVARIIAALLLGIAIHLPAQAQDELFDLLGEDEPQEEFAFATFKTTRVVNSQSIENPAPGVLLFIISHHFGKINSGPYDLFGLDDATIRYGFEYGVNDRLALGFGRSSFEKTYDGFLKYKLIRQQSGKRNMPLTLSYFTSIAVKSLKWDYPERKNYWTSRLSYVHQLLIARKFSNAISLQLMPALIHKNLVASIDDQNTAFAMGMGGRIKMNQRISVNGEYFYVPKGQYTKEINNSLSLGLDIETGGHVFQIHLTNSKPMFDRGFITETQGRWDKGDIYFGFNITRVFTLQKPPSFREDI